MRILGISLLAVLASASLAQAQAAGNYQQLTVGASVVTISSTVRNGSTACRGTLETAAIRIAFGASTPTATSGQPVSVGDQVIIGNRDDIVNFKAIAQTSTAGVLNMTCSNVPTQAPSLVSPAPFFVYSGLALGTPPAGVAVVGGLNPLGQVQSAALSGEGYPLVRTMQTASLPLPLCNALIRYRCQPKGF